MKILLLIFLTFSSAWADQSLETDSFQTVNKKVYELNKKYGRDNVLVVIDIDNTLLTMPNNFGSDQWYEWQTTECLNNKARSKYCITTSFPELIDLQGQIFATANMQLTEPAAKKLVYDLQAEGQSLILLTSRSPEFRNSTMRSLSQHGLSFDKSALPGAQPGTFPPYDLDNLAKDGLSKEDAKIANLRKPRSVSYMNGLSMNSGQNKGIILKTLLHRSGKKFKAIVFVDDHKKHTAKVQEIFGKRDPIEVITFRYSKIDPIVKAFKESDKSDVIRSYEAFSWGKKQAYK